MPDVDIEQVGSVTFEIAPGDPCSIDSAAVWHEQISGQMGAHSEAITRAQNAATSVWQGDAADSYRDLAGTMATAFRTGQVRAGETAATMRSIASGLDRYQQEGKHALRQANHWVQQATEDFQKATRLKADLAAAERGLAGAESSASDGGMDTHTGINPYQNGTPPAVVVAAAKIGPLKAQLKAATQAVHDDNQEIEKWDRRGQQAWDDALSAVGRFTTIPVDTIPAPPMPGVPLLPPPGESGWQTFLGVVQTVSTGVAAGSGILAAVNFWNPAGAVFGTVSAGASAVSAVDGALQYANDPTTQHLIDFGVDTGGLLLDGAGSQLAKSGAGESKSLSETLKGIKEDPGSALQPVKDAEGHPVEFKWQDGTNGAGDMVGGTVSVGGVIPRGSDGNNDDPTSVHKGVTFTGKGTKEESGPLDHQLVGSLLGQ